METENTVCRLEFQKKRLEHENAELQNQLEQMYDMYTNLNQERQKVELALKEYVCEQVIICGNLWSTAVSAI